MRTLALDVGDKTLGVAVSDALGMIATPVVTIRRTTPSEDAAALQSLMEEREVNHVIAGLPVKLDGGRTEQTEKTEATIAALEKALGITIERVDERWSTAAVERMLIDANVRRERRREVKDHLAAAYFLQSWLDARPRAATLSDEHEGGEYGDDVFGDGDGDDSGFTEVERYDDDPSGLADDYGSPSGHTLRETRNDGKRRRPRS